VRRNQAVDEFRRHRRERSGGDGVATIGAGVADKADQAERFTVDPQPLAVSLDSTVGGPGFGSGDAVPLAFDLAQTGFAAGVPGLTTALPDLPSRGAGAGRTLSASPNSAVNDYSVVHFNESYHPNDRGQKLIAAALLQHLGRPRARSAIDRARPVRHRPGAGGTTVHCGSWPDAWSGSMETYDYGESVTIGEYL
jgi:hypothetical protein